jgi:hypothetical protein
LNSQLVRVLVLVLLILLLVARKYKTLLMRDYITRMLPGTCISPAQIESGIITNACTLTVVERVLQCGVGLYACWYHNVFWSTSFVEFLQLPSVPSTGEQMLFYGIQSSPFYFRYTNKSHSIYYLTTSKTFVLKLTNLVGVLYCVKVGI